LRGRPKVSELVIDPVPPRPGLVTSPAVLRLLEFLESSGGAPPGACALLFKRKSDASRRMTSLVKAGYAVKARLGDSELWLPRAHGVWDEGSFLRQRALGWFAARLAESGGKLTGSKAVFPNGSEMSVVVLPYDRPLPPPSVVVFAAGSGCAAPAGCFWCREEDLIEKDLPSCLKYVRPVK